MTNKTRLQIKLLLETLVFGYFIIQFIFKKSDKYITGIDIEYNNLSSNPAYLETRKPYTWRKFPILRRHQ